MSVYITDKDGKLVKVSGSNVIFTLPIGSIFSSAIPIMDANVHLLDGSLISQTGLYKTFANLIKSLVSAGHSISCTQSQFDSDLSAYGQCGKFVIDDTAGTIRLPYIKEFIASNNGGQIIGAAEIDVLKLHTHTTISAGSHTHGPGTLTGYYKLRDSDDGTSNVWGAEGYEYSKYDETAASGSVVLNGGATGSAGAHTHTITETGNGAETKPKNIRYPYYIVLAAGCKPNQVVEMDNIASEMNLKQNKLISNPVALNTTRAGQNDTVIEHYMSSDGNTWYRKWASGWKECGLHVEKTMAPPANGANTSFGNITLPIQFSNKLYQTQITNEWCVSYGDKFFFSAERIGSTSTSNVISVAVTTCTNSTMPSSMTIGCNIYCCGF